MDTQKLHDLIDKVIGKKGPLRVPAYWMRKVLTSMIEHIYSVLNSLKEYIDIQVDDVTAAIKRLGVQVYNYQDLLAIADAGQLEPGRKYIVKYKPFIRTTSTAFTPTYESYSFGEVLLTAASSTEFFEDAILYRSGVSMPVKYVFRKDPARFNWCPFLVEHRVFDDENGFHYTLVTAPESYTANNAYVVYDCRLSDGSTERVRVSNKATNPYEFDIEGVNVPTVDKRIKVQPLNSEANFSGLIYEFHQPRQNIHLPYDPYFEYRLKLTLPNGDVWLHQGLPLQNHAGNITIRPFLQNGVFWLPHIGIYGTGPNSGAQQHLFIDEGCYNMIIQLSTKASIYIGEGSIGVGIKASSTINIPAHSRDVYLLNCNGRLLFEGPAKNVYIESTSEFSFLKVIDGWYLDIRSLTQQHQITVLPSLFRGEDITQIRPITLINHPYGRHFYYFQVGTDRVVKSWPVNIASILTDSGDGTKFLSDDGAYKQITSATVVDEATGDNLDSMLPFKLVIEDPSLPISAENFNKLKAAMVANRPIYIINGGVATIALVIPGEGGRLIANMLVPTMYSTSMCVSMAFFPDDVPDMLTDPGNIPLMVKAGQGLNIELDGTINCTLNISQLSQELQTLKARVDALEGGSLTE